MRIFCLLAYILISLSGFGQKKLVRSNLALDSVIIDKDVYYKIPKHVRTYDYVWTELNKRATKYVKRLYPKDGRYISDNSQDTFRVWTILDGYPNGKLLEIAADDTTIVGEFRDGCKVGYWINSEISESLLDRNIVYLGSGEYSYLGKEGYKEFSIYNMYLFNDFERYKGEWKYFSKDSVFYKNCIVYPSAKSRVCNEYYKEALILKDSFNYMTLQTVESFYDSNGRVHSKVGRNILGISGVYQYWDLNHQLIVDEHILKRKREREILGKSYLRDSLGRIIGTGKSYQGYRSGKWIFNDTANSIFVHADFGYYYHTYMTCSPMTIDYPIGTWFVFDENGDTIFKRVFPMSKVDKWNKLKRKGKSVLFKKINKNWSPCEADDQFDKIFKKVMTMNLRKYYEN